MFWTPSEVLLHSGSVFVNEIFLFRFSRCEGGVDTEAVTVPCEVILALERGFCYTFIPP
jgi:hypothetical protein